MAAFKAAAPYLGLRPNVVHANDWLFRFTVTGASNARIRRAGDRFVSRVGSDQTTTAQQRPGKVRTDSGSLLKITPMELIKLAPRLKLYLHNQAPSWSETVDAADWLRDEMGNSNFIWGDACRVTELTDPSLATLIDGWLAYVRRAAA